MNDTLRILGPFHAHTGYSHMTRAALRMALCAGYTVQAVESDFRIQFTQYTDGRIDVAHKMPDVRLPLPDCQWSEVETALTTEIPPDAPTLFIQLPPALNPRSYHAAGPRIGWSMIESDRVCAEWANGCRGVDTLLAPSQWCVDAFRRSLSETADIQLMPIPIDERIWSADVPPMYLRNRPRFLFVSVFSTTERKQWRLLIHAFAEEFAKESDVGLAVKPSRAEEVRELANWCRGLGAWIAVDTESRSDYEIASLYRAGDCFVLPSPEGFGLPFLEAGFSSIPAIALDAGGAADFVTEWNGYLCPTTPQILIGHLPHVYDSTHRFPLTSLEDLKRTLRRAYEDRGATLQEKGCNALTTAQQYTPASLADRFRAQMERAIERHETVVTARRHFTIPTSQVRRPQVGLALGAWGDTFVSLGMAQAMRDTQRPLHMAHFGMDPHIADFLRAQPFVSTVYSIPPQDRQEFIRVFRRASMSRWTRYSEWLSWFAERIGVPPEDILWTQVNQAEDQPIRRWHGAALPDAIREKAREQHETWGDYILLHPISVQSAFLNEHWPHWEDAIRWLVEETPYTYVLTGTSEMRVPASDRLINLIGKTESMMEVLALCEEARGLISTCNAICLWSVVQEIPCLTVANAVFNWEADYYRRWSEVETNTMLYQYTTIDWFEHVAREWLAERFGIRETVTEERTAEEVMA